MTALLAPVAVAIDEEGSGAPAGAYAVLDGRPLKLKDVSKFYCHDFDYPKITCSRDPLVAQESVAEAVEEIEAVALADGLMEEEELAAYVTVYDYTTFAGSWMTIYNDYDALFWVGWNDRISSYRGRYYNSGTFYTDWYGGGTADWFCCNTYVSSLGGLDNSFSSVYRN